MKHTGASIVNAFQYAALNPARALEMTDRGEIAVGNGAGYKVASTACGPALEGGNIACGMRGMEGAIERVSLQDGKLTYRVIGGVEPLGLCRCV